MKREHQKFFYGIFIFIIFVFACSMLYVWQAGREDDPAATLGEHAHSFKKTITEATCIAQGYTTYTCSCGETYMDNYVSTSEHHFTDFVCRDCGALSDEISYIELSSAEQLYALGRLFSSNQTKLNIYNSGYNINLDLNLFEYPDDITNGTLKVKYLLAASYKLTADVSLTFQSRNDASYFLGIGSTEYPFTGIFNGNGKTVSLHADDAISLSDTNVHQLGFFGNIKNAKITDLNISVDGDILVNQTTDVVMFGTLAGYADECQITNCNTTLTNAQFGVNFAQGESFVHQAHVGGLIGEGNLSTIRNATVTLNDSTLMAQGYDVSKHTTMYAYFSVGGIMGFSNAGSNNSSNIGRIGNQLHHCNVTSTNQNQQEVIFASLEKGDEVTVGGLVGCAFNNFLAQNCSVDISNGNITAQKTGQTDSAHYGTNAGGLLGRLEHTGELSHCSVNGNSLNIVSRSPENYCTAGGIVGYDVGPYHREVISVNNCSVTGNGTTKIILDITANPAINRWNALGGIAGNSSYLISNCSVSDVNLVNKSENVDKLFIGGICGMMNKDTFWTSLTYFVPGQASGVKDSLATGLVCDAAAGAVVEETVGFIYK